jgi:hypothetical protein
MPDIKANFDTYKIETMKKLSQGRFDQIEMRPESEKAKNAKLAEKFW